MNVIEDIERKKQLDEKISSIRKKAAEEEKRTKEIYDLKKCNHDIVIKFYGTIKSFNEEKPLYICLGCQENLTNNAKEIEDNPTKKIIDFTSVYWYDVSKTEGGFNNYALVDYLRNLALEAGKNIEGFTDADFCEMVNDNVSYIKVPKDHE